MVIDRTIEDVKGARQIIISKVQNFLGLSDDELSILERGTITASTINRIENKQKELFELFRGILYVGKHISTREWLENGDIFKDSDLERIIENGEVLRDAFFVYSYTPKKAKVKYDYENLNDIEKLLFDLQEMYGFVVSNFKECDTFYCGEG